MDCGDSDELHIVSWMDEDLVQLVNCFPAFQHKDVTTKYRPLSQYFVVTSLFQQG